MIIHAMILTLLLVNVSFSKPAPKAPSPSPESDSPSLFPDSGLPSLFEPNMPKSFEDTSQGKSMKVIMADVRQMNVKLQKVLQAAPQNAETNGLPKEFWKQKFSTGETRGDVLDQMNYRYIALFALASRLPTVEMQQKATKQLYDFIHATNNPLPQILQYQNVNGDGTQSTMNLLRINGQLRREYSKIPAPVNLTNKEFNADAFSQFHFTKSDGGALSRTGTDWQPYVNSLMRSSFQSTMDVKYSGPVLDEDGSPVGNVVTKGKQYSGFMVTDENSVTPQIDERDPEDFKKIARQLSPIDQATDGHPVNGYAPAPPGSSYSTPAPAAK